MKRIYLCMISMLFLFVTGANAQFSKYIIVLKDKNNSPFTLNNPSAYLSAKAITRRQKQSINIDSTDLPINPFYIDSLQNAGAVTVLNSSKWLNQVLIQTSDAAALDKIQQFPFVQSFKGIAPRVAARIKDPDDKLVRKKLPSKKANGIQGVNDYFNYGSSYNQINIHEGEFLHNKGFRGEGMTIAILDGGFYHYDTNPAFDSVRLNNQVLGTWDFVANKTSVTEEHYHGMVCFSTIAANRPGIMVGTSPKSKFYLFRTEDVYSEFPVEEQNWAAAAERADSLGVDLITTSLGYSTFDDSSLDYTYAQMDGKTTICARAAEWATKKGIFVTVSAGNSGTSEWHYISTPADAEHVLSIGSVTYAGQPSDFSSYGPSADGRIKPDVASVGSNTVVAGLDGNPTGALSGTSLANPNLAGLVACLWQAFPEFTNMDIRDAIQKSSSKYNNPDDRIGYGIPNMRIAYNLLDAKRQQQNVDRILGDDWIKAYPVPFTSSFNVLVKPTVTDDAFFILYTTTGATALTKTVSVQAGTAQSFMFSNVANLAPGVYWLKYKDKANSRVLRLVKQ
ncbi:MAG: S8 family serine peptidase [Agriterribacter sp.]